MMNELIRTQHIHQRKRFSPLPLQTVRPRLSPITNHVGSFVRLSEAVVFPAPRSKRERKFILLLFPVAILLAGIGAVLSTPWPAGPDQFKLPVDGASDNYVKAYIQQGLTKTALDNDVDSIPLALTEQFAWQTYRVRNGDTLIGIAKSFNLSIDAIIALNGITNARSLRSGSTLKIPNMDGVPYTVKKGDTLLKIANSWGIPLDAILDANDLSSEVINPGMKLFLPGARLSSIEVKRVIGNLLVYPIIGRLTSPFGWRNDPFTGVRRFHAAIDIAQNIGTRVGAAMDGRVSATGYNSVYGNYLILSHDGGYQTMYAHLNSIAVKKGARVVQKGTLGTVGNTGYSTGPHLHFAIFKNGRAVNPLELLGK